MDLRSEGLKRSCSEEFIRDSNCTLFLRATIQEDDVLKLDTDQKLRHAVYSFFIVHNNEVRRISGISISPGSLAPENVVMMSKEFGAFAYVFTFILDNLIISACEDEGEKTLRITPIAVKENGVSANKVETQIVQCGETFNQMRS
jgi:hypothetical protein